MEGTNYFELQNIKFMVKISVAQCSGIFHSHIPSGRTIFLGWTVTEMSTRNTSWPVKVAGT